MAVVELLNAGRDAAKWNNWLDLAASGQDDIYARPAYGSLYCLDDRERFLLFAYGEGSEAWIYPFLSRPLPAQYLDITGVGASDIETPYGYGGPVSNSNDGPFLARANAAFRHWCSVNGVVAEFVRLHPLLGNQRWLAPGTKLILDRQTVSLNLTDPRDVSDAFDRNSMGMVKRAWKCGIVVAESDSERDFQQFVGIYSRTMTRIGADAFYHFDPRHFRHLWEVVQTSGMLLVAKLSENVVGGAIFLKGKRWLHYHLSATDPDRRVPGATNAIIHRAAERGRAAGLTRLHLGGGTTAAADDSLLLFKRRMSTDSHEFWIGKHIHDSEAYSKVCTVWRQQNRRAATRYGNRILCYRFADPTPLDRMTSEHAEG